MQELVGGIAALSGVIEKGGIVGVMLILTAFLGWWSHRLRKQLAAVYRQRDRCRLISVRYRSHLDAAGIKVDISDILEMLGDDEEIA